MSSKNTKFKQVLLLARTQLELISEKVNLHTVLYFSHPSGHVICSRQPEVILLGVIW